MTTNNYINTVIEYNKKTYENLKELTSINKKSMEQIAEQQLALFNLMVDSNTRLLETVGKAKGYTEVLNAQSELSADFNGKALGIVRNTADILNESKDEVSAWLEKQATSVPTVKPSAKDKAA